MKRIVVVLLYLMAFNYSNAQEYIPLPTTDAIWCEYNAIWTGGLTSEIYPHYMILQGDTLINNITYHKIIQSFIDTLLGNYDDFYRGSFREDSNKQVFLILKDSLEDVIIYDFSKEIGDTIYIIGGSLGWKSGYDTTLYIIDNIDSVLIEGNYRKKFSFDDSNLIYNFDWIEGIGSMGGLLHSFYPFGIKQRYELNCLTQSGEYIFHNPESWLTDCFVFTGILEENNFNQDILVYPNPSNGIYYVKSNNDQSFTIYVYTELGDLLLKKELNGSSNSIDLSYFNSGIYILKIYNLELMKIYLKKIILKK